MQWNSGDLLVKGCRHTQQWVTADGWGSLLLALAWGRACLGSSLLNGGNSGKWLAGIMVGDIETLVGFEKESILHLGGRSILGNLHTAKFNFLVFSACCCFFSKINFFNLSWLCLWVAGEEYAALCLSLPVGLLDMLEWGSGRIKAWVNSSLGKRGWLVLHS